MSVKSTVYSSLFTLVLALSLSSFATEPHIPNVTDVYNIYNYSTLKAHSTKTKFLTKIMENDFSQKRYALNFITTEIAEIDTNLHSQGSTNTTRNATSNATKFKQFYLKFTCDGDFYLSAQFGFKKFSKTATGLVFGGERNPLVFAPFTNLSECTVNISDSGFEDSNGISLKLISEKNVPGHKIIQDLRRSKEVCDYFAEQDLNRHVSILQKYINSNSNFSCMQKIEIEPLSSGLLSLKEKVKILLGQDLPNDVYESRIINNDIEIDFSKAPQLKAILISTLIFEDDFYGYLIGRILEHHASKGTPIKILVSENTLSHIGKNYISYLTTHYSNVSIQSYTWKSNFKNIKNDGRLVDGFHRVQHTKYFLTLGQNPEQTRLFIGGRNIGTAYLEPTDLENNTNLYFEDFQAVIKNEAYVYSVARKIISLWDLDNQKYTLRPTRAQRSTEQHSKSFTEHKNADYAADLISIPFSDSRNLEGFYVEMINAAKINIKISTPYFSPTPAIKKAIVDASQRGVSVEILTNISLNGDTAGSFITDINRIVINEFKKISNVIVYAYKQPYAIYHSKYILIDNSVSLVGSVNLNQRSFIHDIENLTVILGSGYSSKMTQIWNRYVSQSSLVTEDLPILGISGPLLKLIAEDLD